MKRVIESLESIINFESVMEDLNAVSDILDEQSKIEDTIIALRDTDYREKEAFFKMVELLKGLAVASDEDEMAREFMSAVSDSMTDIAKEVMSEED